VSCFRRLALAAVLLLALPPTLAAASGFPKPVAEALRAASVPAYAVAILVQEAGAARPSLSIKAGCPGRE
jgi:hypothetical protein